jgi:hypothetical protein
MNLSIITSRIVNGVEYVLYRNNDEPRKTYVDLDGVLTEISIKDFMRKYGS